MRLFYIWHESQMGPPKVELTIVRAKDMVGALDKFNEAMTKEYLNYLVTLQIKACNNLYLD